MAEGRLSPRAKRILNRGGLGMVAIGVVAHLIGGGDAGTAAEVVSQVGTIGGALLVFIRELTN